MSTPKDLAQLRDFLSLLIELDKRLEIAPPEAAGEVLALLAASKHLKLSGGKRRLPKIRALLQVHEGARRAR